MKNLFCLTLILIFSSSGWAQSGGNKQENSPHPEKKATRPVTSPAPTPESGQTDDPANAAAVNDDEVLRVETNLVTLPVSVSDTDGRFVAGLKKEDFEILENGKPQQIEYFAPVETPFTVALVLDTSLSAKFKIDEIQTAAYLFVMGLRPADRVLIVSFDEEVRVLSEPTNDRETLRQAIMRTKFGSGTSLYEAVSQTLDRLKTIQGRKAMVLFTDGVDTTSRLATEGDNLRQAEELDALVYPVYYDTYENVQAMMRTPPPILNPNPIPGSPVPFPREPLKIPGTNIPFPLPPRRDRQPQQRRESDPSNTPPGDNRDVVITGKGASSPEYRRGREFLEKISLKTGGRFYQAETNGGLTRAFDQVAEELRRQYSLGYYPEAQGEQGERRKVKVRVNRKKVSVRSRDEYIVRKPPIKSK